MATPEPIRDPILERALPSSPDTERAILGAIILDNSLISSGGVLFLTNLTNGLPHVTSVVQFAKVVRGKSLLRQLVKVANKITAEALEEEDEPQNILDHAEHAIFALADERIRQGF